MSEADFCEASDKECSNTGKMFWWDAWDELDVNGGVFVEFPVTAHDFLQSLDFIAMSSQARGYTGC